MTRRKIGAALILVLCLAAGLAACGRKGDPLPPPDAEDPAKPARPSG